MFVSDMLEDILLGERQSSVTQICQHEHLYLLACLAAVSWTCLPTVIVTESVSSR